MKKFCLGLTLIELLVVMAITALITGGSLAAYSSFNKGQAVKAVASDLKNNLRLAQGKASAQEKPSGCGCYTGYQVAISPASYSIQAFCKTEIVDYSCGPAQAITVPSGVNLTAVLPPLELSVRFWIMKGGATPAAITVSGFGRNALVNVTKTGEIY